MIRVTLEECSEEAVQIALDELGVVVEESSWGVGGAVEQTRYRLTLGVSVATLLIQSYEGPELHGDDALVNGIAAAVARIRGSVTPPRTP